MNQHTEQETNIEDTHSSLEYIRSMCDTMFNILQHIQGQNKKIKKRDGNLEIGLRNLTKLLTMSRNNAHDDPEPHLSRSNEGVIIIEQSHDDLSVELNHQTRNCEKERTKPSNMTRNAVAGVKDPNPGSSSEDINLSHDDLSLQLMNQSRTTKKKSQSYFNSRKLL